MKEGRATKVSITTIHVCMADIQNRPAYYVRSWLIARRHLPQQRPKSLPSEPNMDGTGWHWNGLVNLGMIPNTDAQRVPLLAPRSSLRPANLVALAGE